MKIDVEKIVIAEKLAMEFAGRLGEGDLRTKFSISKGDIKGRTFMIDVYIRKKDKSFAGDFSFDDLACSLLFDDSGDCQSSEVFPPYMFDKKNST